MTQLALFADVPVKTTELKSSRSGTFIDNMRLPVHRWFRYSAGFAAEWVEQLLSEWGIGATQVVLDPFVGSGTVPVVCDKFGIESVGIEAHPFVSRICRAKSLWPTDIQQVADRANQVIDAARGQNPDLAAFPQLIRRSFDEDALTTLAALKAAWLSLQDASPESELVWLALTAILRPAARAGTAQWQYILPNKPKKQIVAPLLAFRQQLETMLADMRWMQLRVRESRAKHVMGDAKQLASLVEGQVDAVITSPPYANNYDYADALRFEMTFWGDVNSWGDIHDLVRKHLIVSSSQHSSRERLRAEDLLELDVVDPIRAELRRVVETLAEVRASHGGNKSYHTMVAAYCRDIGLVLRELRRVCRPGARMCWVVGDSAPYGVYCPMDAWIGQLAVSAGFSHYRFEKLRDRNLKWKNRKHRVPLKEGLLWIEG